MKIFTLFKDRAAQVGRAQPEAFADIEDEDVLAVALHEAAHALAALKEGCDVPGITCYGYCGGWNSIGPVKASSDQAARISLAGLAADLVFARDPRSVLDQCVHDCRLALAGDKQFLDDLRVNVVSFNDELVRAVAFVAGNCYLILRTAQYLIEQWSQMREPSTTDLLTALTPSIALPSDSDRHAATQHLALFAERIGELDALVRQANR